MTPQAKHITIGLSAVVVAGAITAILVTRSTKKKEVADIMAKLDTGAGATGTIADLNSDDAFNVNLLTSGRIPTGAGLIKVAVAQDYAKKLKGMFDQYGGTYDDETGAISLLAQIGTKAKVSQVAKEFGRLYGTPMGDFLTTKIDKSNNPDLFKSTMNSMKLY